MRRLFLGFTAIALIGLAGVVLDPLTNAAQGSNEGECS